MDVTDLTSLRRAAEDLAKSRKERPSTGHALCVLGDDDGPAQVLLSDRRLTREVLLQAARIAQDDDSHKLSEAYARARDFAGRTGPSTQGPSGLHLLFALCQEPKSAAYRMLAQLGVDIGKLRTQAMQIAAGVLAAPRARQPVIAQTASRTATQTPTVAMPLRPPTLTQAAKALAPERPKARPEPQVVAKASEPQVTPQRSKNRRREPRAKSTLAKLALCWSDAIREGNIIRPLGRAREVQRALDALGKLEDNNPCLVGAPGVGKTSAALAVAFELTQSEVEVWMLSAAQVLARAPRAELPGRLAAIEAELCDREERCVLVLEDLPSFFAPEAGDDLAAFARRMLERHRVPCLCTAETTALKTMEAREGAAARGLLTLELDELSHAEVFEIVKGRQHVLEAHHAVNLEPEVIERAVTMTERYLPKSAIAERTLHLVDLALARAKRKKELALSAETLASVVSELTQVPEERVLETDQQRMLKLESLVGERLVGHEKAIGRIASVLRRNATGLGGKRPIGVFLLLGPTGVGKTETAKAIAECMFHSEHAMTRLDLSEYAEAHAVARLVGAPPGYIGHEAGGQLTQAVRKRPHQVVLLDEIEKAHRDVLEAFLAVFDEGIMTDGRGVTVSFENTVIFLTSNLGADAVKPREARIGFGARARSVDSDDVDERVLEAARGGLPPELWNRFDDVLVFPTLSREALHDIAHKMLGKLAALMQARHQVTLSWSVPAIEHLLDAGGFAPEFGARPMRRTLARLVEAELAERVLRGQLPRGAHVFLDRGRDGLDLTIEGAGHARAAS